MMSRLSKVILTLSVLAVATLATVQLVSAALSDKLYPSSQTGRIDEFELKDEEGNLWSRKNLNGKVTL